MKTVNWDDLPEVFRDRLFDIQDQHGCFTLETTYLETILKKVFKIDIQVTVYGHGEYFHEYNFIFDEKDYTLLILKFS